MIKELLLLMLGFIVVDNLAFEKLLGLVPVIGGKTAGKKALFTGAAVGLVMLLTAVIAWPLKAFVLDRLGLAALETFVFVLVVLIVVFVLDLIIKNSFNEPLGMYFPVIALNAAVLGLALNNAAEGFSFLQALFAALGAGLGYILAMLLFAGVQSRIQQKYVPAAFRGLPISVLAAAIISMALVAFK